MRSDNAGIVAAMNRNFAEANDAVLKLAAYRGLDQAGLNATGVNFFAIAKQALFND